MNCASVFWNSVLNAVSLTASRCLNSSKAISSSRIQLGVGANVRCTSSTVTFKADTKRSVFVRSTLRSMFITQHQIVCHFRANIFHVASGRFVLFGHKQTAQQMSDRNQIVSIDLVRMATVVVGRIANNF